MAMRLEVLADVQVSWDSHQVLLHQAQPIDDENAGGNGNSVRQS